MALPAWVTWQAAKSVAPTVLKWAGALVIAWFVWSSVNSYVAEQKAVRTEIVTQTTARVQAESQVRALTDAQTTMEREAKNAEKALAEARLAAGQLNNEFTQYRRDQAKLLQNLRAEDFAERTQAEPAKAAAEANALMTNLNAQMEGVFDGS